MLLDRTADLYRELRRKPEAEAEAVQRGRLYRTRVALAQPSPPDRSRRKLGWTLDEARALLRAAADHRLDGRPQRPGGDVRAYDGRGADRPPRPPAR